MLYTDGITESERFGEGGIWTQPTDPMFRLRNFIGAKFSQRQCA